MFYHLLFFIILYANTCALATQSLVLGTIQFPKNIQQVPTLRIYYKGLIIPAECDEQGKKIVFKIPTSAQTHFYFLITKNLGCEIRQKSELSAQNTIEFWKIIKGTPYKFFVLYAVPDEENNTQQWVVKEMLLDESGRIPDNAIIVRYPAEYIEKLAHATSFEFPAIVLKPNLLDLIGSQKKLIELSDMLMLASLDTDTFHATISQEIIKQDKKHHILVPPAA